MQNASHLPIRSFFGRWWLSTTVTSTSLDPPAAAAPG
eukprot:CAMPEP_0180248314 /NCGR_PEP_ID=MMETSP0987-20121128/36648_1 /TAXON_ID=697907 /ORGANISM="non described non described, Strain CCMP2293" /LENGTH=36 /DNA_ID= /DNA_START= /DNA_END= /DNA_ORIENTATION=